MALSRLYIPAANDGVIDKNDTSLGVYVVIPQSVNAAKGDTLTLYWGSNGYNITIVDVSRDYPVVLRINQQDLITEGYQDIFYEVRDAVGNISRSNVIEVLICSDCSALQNLPPLNIHNAESDSWLNQQEINEDNGVVLYINADPVFKPSDQIHFFWQEKYPNGEPVINSQFTQDLTLKESDIGQKISVTVPSDTVLLASSGVMTARYTLFSNSGDIHFSNTVSAGFNFDSADVLPPPMIQHKGSAGKISSEDIILFQGVEVIVPESEFLKAGDNVTLYWQGYSSEGSEQPLTAFQASYAYLGTDNVNFRIPAEYVIPITNGSGRVYYTISSGDITSVSPIDTTLIAFNSGCNLSSPDISFAIDHALTNAIINQQGGVSIRILSEGLTAGDILNIYSSGYDEKGLYDPSLSFTGKHLISSNDIASGVDFLIPDTFFSSLTDYHYTLGISISSQPACGAFNYFRIITEGVAIGDNLHASTGYYPWNEDTLQECYVEFHSGEPDTSISMTLTGEGYFVRNHTQNISVTTDTHGTALVSISSASPGLNQITAVDKNEKVYSISLTTNKLNTSNTPWIERTEYTGSVANIQAFNAYIDTGSGIFLLKTSNGTIIVDGKDTGNIVYDYQISHGASRYFEIQAIGDFTVSLCDSDGQVICACSLAASS